MDYTKEYAWGIICCYSICGLIWGYLSIFNFNKHKLRSLAGAFGVLAFTWLSKPNYTFFIVQGHTVSPDIITDKFLNAAFFLILSACVWFERG